MEINWTRNAGPVDGPYHPAGHDWQAHVRTVTTQAIIGAELQSEDPERLARRWGGVLERPVECTVDAFQIAVDNAHLRFVPARDGRGEGLGGIDVHVSDADWVRERARERGLRLVDQSVVIGGVRFNLEEPSV